MSRKRSGLFLMFIIAVGLVLIQPVFAEPAVQKGDVNRDGSINAIDALLVLRHAVNDIVLQGDQKALADVNEDTVINSKDALEILKRSVDEKYQYQKKEYETPPDIL